jgi:hypothetical protein
MTKRGVLAWMVLCAAVLTIVSCRRSDVRVATISVPQMSDAKSIRIVTNAALDEIVGKYDGIKNQYEVDLTKKQILYHESQRLFSPEYQRRIKARIAEVGYSSSFASVRHNPPPPVPTTKGLVQMWPDRITSVISVPNMTSITDANRVIDAIAYARLGADDSRISVDTHSRRLVVAYESLLLSRKNIEYAIAGVGFDANDVPARLGQSDALPDGWSLVQL